MFTTNPNLVRGILAQLRSQMNDKGQATISMNELVELERAAMTAGDGCRYCADVQNWWMFQANVRVPDMETGLTEDLPVPVFRCPHCGRELRQRPAVAPVHDDWSIPPQGVESGSCISEVLDIEDDCGALPGDTIHQAYVPNTPAPPAAPASETVPGDDEGEETSSDFFEGV